MGTETKALIALASLATLALVAVGYRARGWIAKSLTETNGEPSASRLVALLTAVANIGAFLAWGTYLVVVHGKEPDFAAWGTYMGWTQLGGSMPYAVNQLRRAFTERKNEGNTQAQLATGG